MVKKQKFLHKLSALLQTVNLPPAAAPVFLLALAILAYGLLFTKLGFYWDEWPYIWISQKLGSAGLARYFSTNRPIWGLLYQVSTAILAPSPWQWQLFGIFWRWVSSAGAWWLVRLVWPKNPSAAVWVGILFLLYPGFDQQPIAMMFGHFLMVLSALLFSFCLMLLALRRKWKPWLLTTPALVLSMLNLLSMEYFFLLEMLRPLLIWFVVGEDQPDRNQRLKRSALQWLPYLAVFGVAILWRLVFFKFQTQNYQPVFFDQLKAAPIQSLLSLAAMVGRDLWTVTLYAWSRAFQFPDPQVFGLRSLMVYSLVVIAAAFLVILFLLASKKEQENPRFWPQMLASGLFALLVCGWPFWLTGLPVTTSFPLSRFTLPFMLGSSLFFAALLEALPGKRPVKALILGVAASLAVGYQFQIANEFRRDWNTQKALFWQMAWRMPRLETGTALITNDLPTHFTSDNSLSAPLNYIYAPDNHSEKMSFMLYFSSIRTKNYFTDYRPGQPIQHNYLAATFYGNTSQVIAFYFNPPGCLRVLDPEIEKDNIMLPEAIKSAAALSSSAPILAAAPEDSYTPPVTLFGSELPHGWCYYFEKADLARQQKDWAEVVKLGDTAFSLDDHPNDPLERLPFIEGYAQSGQWQRALDLSFESLQVSSLTQPSLCALWRRIDAQAPPGSEKDTAVQLFITGSGCQ
jgi:hypothetical protein